MKLFKKKKVELDINDLVAKINKKNLPQRYCLFIIGLFIYALSFSLFFSPNNMVVGGTNGLALIFREWVGLKPSVFVAIISYGLLIISFFYLDKTTTVRNILGTVLYPIFVEFTEKLVPIFNITSSSLFLLMIYGGVLYGFASGLVFKTGFSTGGMDITYQLMSKYLKISIGKARLIISVIIILLGLYVFGIYNVCYTLIALGISTIITDHVILGTSADKSFYIITSKQKEVKELIINNLSHSVTEIDTKGGYTNNKNKLLMTVVPTKEYFTLKESVLAIDKDAFFLITDSYERKNGT